VATIGFGMEIVEDVFGLAMTEVAIENGVNATQGLDVVVDPIFVVMGVWWLILIWLALSMISSCSSRCTMQVIYIV
jgi:hypothetical protein